jgi:hypothetical protein
MRDHAVLGLLRRLALAAVVGVVTALVARLLGVGERAVVFSPLIVALLIVAAGRRRRARLRTDAVGRFGTVIGPSGPATAGPGVTLAIGNGGAAIAAAGCPCDEAKPVGANAYHPAYAAESTTARP